MLKRWNIGTQLRYTVSTLVILLLVILLITTSSISWLLLNDKSSAHAAGIGTMGRVNGKSPYAITPARPANKVTTTITTATSSTSHSISSKSLPSFSTSLSSVINRIKEGNKNSNNNLIKPPSPLLDTNHIFLHDNSKSNSMKPSTFKNTVHTEGSNRKINIAFIKPLFTTAAYNDSFYIFYTLYDNIPAGKNVTANLNLLTSKVTSQTTDSSSPALAMLYLSKNIKSSIPKSNIVVLTDSDVDAGNIFTKSKSNKYNILIIGHQEYVTQHEYSNLRKFVANGGTMIILDGNIFYAEVKYDKDNNTITLVKGHGWAFNGRSAWKSVAERWKDETSQWVGSNYLCYQCGITFDNDPFEYRHHEEQYITNPKDVILFNYNASMPNHKPLLKSSLSPLSSTRRGGVEVKHIIATYELSYQKGKVIALGIYSDDIITNSKFDKYFDGLLLRYAL